MAEIEVRDLKNKVVGKLELTDEVFNYEASETLVWEAVKAYQAAQRKGTHAAKGRSDMRGGGRKPWRQKGTGRARAGTIRSPLWAGGGTVHPPKPRDYSEALPKKKRRGAMKLVLTDRLKNERLLVFDNLNLETPRTKEFVSLLKTLGIEQKVLLIDGKQNRNLYLGSRNIKSAKLVSSDGVNIYDLLNHELLIFSKSAVLELQEVLKK
jgi:large subunit ribosomal protein L4